MQYDQLQAKLKKITNKNKKLLQSVSTHLINHPDELEGKLHEHRYLEQKYNELIGFSRDNVDKYEKMQSALLEKDQEIYKLTRLLSDSKNQAIHRVEAMERQNRRKHEKDEVQLLENKKEIQELIKTLGQKDQKNKELEK